MTEGRTSIPKPKGRFPFISWLVIIVGGICGLLILGTIAVMATWKGSRALLAAASPTAAPAGSFPKGWISSGPEGGNIQALAIDSTNADIIYAGTAVQGVFKSTDGGQTWNAVNTGMDSSTAFDILCLAIDPVEPSNIYAGTKDGLYKSLDSGLTWKSVTIDPANIYVSISALALDPQAHATLYASTGGNQLYKSSDGGETWTAHAVGGENENITSLAIEPGSAGTIYAGSFGGLWKSSDGGNNWSTITLLPDYTGVFAITFDPASPAAIYLGTDNGVMKSRDGGQTWAATGLTGGGVETLAVDPLSASRLYAAIPIYNHVVYPPELRKSGLFTSTDGGDHWSKISPGDFPADQINCLILTPAALYAGTRKGFYKGSADGSDWLASNSGLKAIAITALAADSDSPTSLYAAAGEQGVFKSTDGGASWEAASSGLPAGYVSILVLDPQTPDTLYALERNDTLNGTWDFEGLGVYKSTDGGGSWKLASTGLNNPAYVSVLLIDPHTPSTLYALSSFDGVDKTNDGGASWNKANTGIPNSTSIRSLAIDLVNPQKLYAATDERLYTTTDGGENWNETPTDLAIFSITSLWTSPAEADTLYASTYIDGQIKSTDGGAHWTAWDPGLGSAGLKSLSIDPQAPANLYGAGDNTGAGSVFDKNTVEWPLFLVISRDGGKSWSKVNTGLNGLVIYTLMLDPAEPATIYLGTSQGVFKGSYNPGH